MKPRPTYFRGVVQESMNVYKVVWNTIIKKREKIFAVVIMYKIVLWETFNYIIYKVTILTYLVGVKILNFIRLMLMFNKENIFKQIIPLRIPDKAIYFKPDI